MLGFELFTTCQLEKEKKEREEKAKRSKRKKGRMK